MFTNLLISICVMTGLLIGILLNILVSRLKQSLPTEPTFPERSIAALTGLIPLIFILMCGTMINNFSSSSFYGVSGSLALYLASIFSIPVGFVWVKIYREHGEVSFQNFAVDALVRSMISGYNILNRKAKKSDFISFIATFSIIVGLWSLVTIFALNVLGKYL